MKTIKIRCENYEFSAQLYDTNTAKTLYKSLPIEGTVQTWGDELYFYFSTHIPIEPDATNSPEVGQLGYWPSGRAFCIFFGPTPLSNNDKPKAASAVNVFGELLNLNIEALRSVKDNSVIRIEI